MEYFSKRSKTQFPFISDSPWKGQCNINNHKSMRSFCQGLYINVYTIISSIHPIILPLSLYHAATDEIHLVHLVLQEQKLWTYWIYSSLCCVVVVFKLNVCSCFLVPGHDKFDISQYLFVINQNNYSSNKTVADLELFKT